MFLKENIALAIAGLKSNKMRAFLTMLGIIIGIGSVIAIVSIGDAISDTFTDAMSDFGANNIYVYVSTRDSDTYVDKMDDADLISMEQIEKFQNKYSDKISGISVSQESESGKAREGHHYANVTIDGVNPGYEGINNLKIDQGRFLRDKDIKGNRSVAVVSDKLVTNMFRGNANPIGKKVNIDTEDGYFTYTIVGVYKYEQSAFSNSGAVSEKDTRTPVYIPVSLAKENADNQNYGQFSLRVKNGVDADSFTNKISTYWSKLYSNNSKFTIKVENAQNELAQMTSALGKISIAVAAIAAIALLVGGVGVMNIMLVSVTERTREIGTRKALGARSGYIKMQFIIESIIICVVGGIIGIIVGMLLAWLGTSLMSMKFAVSVPVIIISVGFSMLIGIFFGYYPAKKAAKLDPIEALRYE